MTQANYNHREDRRVTQPNKPDALDLESFAEEIGGPFNACCYANRCDGLISELRTERAKVKELEAENEALRKVISSDRSDTGFCTKCMCNTCYDRRHPEKSYIASLLKDKPND